MADPQLFKKAMIQVSNDYRETMIIAIMTIKFSAANHSYAKKITHPLKKAA